ncbi:Gfo/Idh/MocA family protein [Paenibacillus sacheonensis]|uniref:Gfo/Idh/MocA family oxidoreductase n=1 Tax=Paenibacillus sacheonensis TaxID=742054 RepID=A0A7X5BVX9_9BACL|nr:Gfo/Idh/MocA family oxidoreductase [Paenibacillus sacheonensis]MBM7565843.1 putative dehydrogenase [Paenibacillus sacheonensis]NBC68838.1 Gfo/Idh/MocA family oxidoreductase [Paenibacillus sacheonensis]
MRIGIISFAHMHAWSYAHAIKRNPHAELVGIADDDAERGQRMTAEFGTAWFASEDELIASVDAVIVCSENSKHAAYTIAAAKQGKHILCEKPIATNVEDAKAMIAAAEEADVQLMIAFPCRFSTVAQRMKERIASGELGSIVAFGGTNRGSMPWGWFADKQLAGGGAVMDHTVHVLDVMRWYMPGAEVTEVYAEVDNRFHVDAGIDDCGLLTFSFDNGVIASLDPSWSRPRSNPVWGDLTLDLVGTEGSAKVDLYKQNMTLHSDDTLKTTAPFWGDNPDQGLIDHFVSCVISGNPVSVTGTDGLRALEVALAAYKSAELKTPVFLNA